MDGLREAIMKIKPVTRWYLGIALFFSFCMTYGIIPGDKLILDWTAVFKQGQIWRVLTTFFVVGPFSMPFLFGMMMIYYSVSSIEEYFGQEKQADLGTMMLFNAVMSLLYAYIANDYMVMQSPYLFSIIYTWSKFVPDVQISIWGFPVQSCNLPWVLMAFHLFTGGNPLNDLIGVAAGHTYIYLKTILPDSHGYDLIKTPSFMHSVVQKLNSMGEDPRRAPRGNARMMNLNNRDGVADPQAQQQPAAGQALNRGQNAQGNAAFRAFAGRGVRIGGE